MDFYEGTEIKININIEAIGSVTMNQFQFVVDAYCVPSRVLTVTKEEATEVDANSYFIKVDTAKTGPGRLKLRVKAEIPDPDFDDVLRTEVQIVDPDVNVLKAQ